MRIRFVRFELPLATIVGVDAERGFPIPDVEPGWTPFQIETERVPLKPWFGSGERPSREDRVVVEVWLREDETSSVGPLEERFGG